MSLLLEFDVVNAVASELENRGYTISQRLQPTQRGHDIIARKRGPPPLTLYVEAKGETSSRVGSQRFGKPFDSAQTKIHVAEAFFTAAETLAQSPGHEEVKAGIALPNNELHRRYEAAIHQVLMSLGIAVFWVCRDTTVEVNSSWQV